MSPIDSCLLFTYLQCTEHMTGTLDNLPLGGTLVSMMSERGLLRPDDITRNAPRDLPRTAPHDLSRTAPAAPSNR